MKLRRVRLKPCCWFRHVVVDIRSGGNCAWCRNPSGGLFLAVVCALSILVTATGWSAEPTPTPTPTITLTSTVTPTATPFPDPFETVLNGSFEWNTGPPRTLPLAWEDAGNYGGSFPGRPVAYASCTYWGLQNPFDGWAWIVGSCYSFDYDEIYQDVPVTVGDEYSISADLALGGAVEWGGGSPVSPDCRGRMALDCTGSSEWDTIDEREMVDPGVNVFALSIGPFVAAKSPVRVSLFGQSPDVAGPDFVAVAFDNVEIVRHAAGESTEVRNWELYR